VLLRVHNMLEVRLLHLSENVQNLARLENSERIADLGDWEHDFANQRLLWSDGIYRILGIARNDFPPNTETFYGHVHPDDVVFVHRAKKLVADGAHRADFEHRLIRADGQLRHIHQIVEMTLDGHGRPLRESGIMQDVTDRRLAEADLRRSEERFRLVARAVSDVVWDWDVATGAFWWNDGFRTTFGFAAGDVAPSVEFWTGQIHPEDRDRVMASVRRALAGTADTWGEEYRFLRRDGSHALVVDRGYIVRDPAGRALRIMGGMRDLTEQRKLEAQVLRAERMDSIGTLAGGIAHDLNNVFAPVMMAIELLTLDAGDDPRRSKILNTIFVSCHRGADLVRQVLAFARGLDGQRVAVQLRRVVADLDAIISETFPRNIRIVTEVPGGLWPILGDHSQLHQVLLNLAVNARDAMPGGGTLTLTAANVDLDAQAAAATPGSKAGPYVLLEVTDTGGGIPPEVRDRIFEPFFTTKELGKGTGIGLATVHTVVKSHGGFLGLTSVVGRGTTFRIYLPADPNLRVEAAAPEMAPAPLGRQELVLVVDDEVAIRDITRKILEKYGYRAITAGDGAEAVALYALQRQEISLVITDLMMPIMDGVAVVRALRRINPRIRIIAMSGLQLAGDGPGSASAGVAHVLPKPFSAQALLRLIHEVLAMPEVEFIAPDSETPRTEPETDEPAPLAAT
jgi:PAS domain S-box-containing protein